MKMAISLYDLSVGTYRQITGAVSGFMDKGATHFAEQGIDTGEVVNTSLYPNMANFHFQAVCVVHHSVGALKGIQAGVFEPPAGYPETDYAGLQKLVADAHDELGSFSADDVNALTGKPVTFKLGANEIPFIAENFIQSFSLPNFYFHATTAYDILRTKGVPIGKRDFMGQLRVGA